MARLLAGVFDLSHGFWVLLTVLTLLRTSAADTRSTLRPALVGTTAGALVAAALLVVGLPPTVYAIALPVIMLVGFAAGPLLGPGWAQALFTLVIAFVFAQVSPVDWRLAEARIVDVVIGAGIGVLIGLLAWPRGGSGELHRATGTFLAAAADVVRETVGVLARDAAQGGALPRAREAGMLAEASYALYQTERHPARGHRLAGHPRGGPPRRARRRGAPARLPDRLPAAVPRRRSPRPPRTSPTATTQVGAGLLDHDGRATAPLPQRPALDWPTDLGMQLYALADLRVWLDGLRDDLGRIASVPADDDLRTRVAHLADGAELSR